MISLCHRLLTVGFATTLLLSCGNSKKTRELSNTISDSLITDTNEWVIEDAGFDEGNDFDNQTTNKNLYVNNTDNIKTGLIYAGDSEMNAPILSLNSEEKLTLSFDVLGDTMPNLAYRIIHCNANWQPSDIFETDYIQGTNSETFSDINSSFNTHVKYFNYQTQIPNDYQSILLSGNYFVQVYNSDYPEETLLQMPFYVVKQQTTIATQVVAPRVNQAKNVMQNATFTIKYNNMEISNPYSDVYVRIIQNQQRYTAIEGLQPSFIQDNTLFYEYDEPTYFQGGNEYRFFDLKSINYQTPEVAKIKFDGAINHAYLATSKKRSFDIYTTQPDINGRYIIKNDDAEYMHFESDYFMTHFALNFDFALPNGDIYIAGGLTQNQLLPEYKLNYNVETKLYTADIMLKQGYYNYMFVTQFNENNEMDLSYVEGSHKETENDYSIYVYLKNQSLNTHELIGYQRYNSIK